MTPRTALVVLFAVSMAQAQTPIRGFSDAQAVTQQSLEAKLKALPDPTLARQYMQKMAAEPHQAGSPASKAVAEYGLSLFKSWGLDAHIEQFEALLPYPTARVLEMTGPVRYKARITEPVLKEDPDSGDARQLPLYNAYSASGDVTAPLVYVNYGIPEDYEMLKKLGVDVKGKIALARYGKSWRGTKAKVAQENGAVGCLIYSDPRDDGFWQGDTYPNGPWRHRESAQRGSVMDMPLYVGDPLTPGWASEPGGKKLAREQAATLMKIPVMPIASVDALPMLRQLKGDVAPPEWRGALPTTYHLGPGPATVHLKLDFDWTSKPIYNVIAKIPGSTTPDEWVLYGNHHDAWVNGAGDPVSGAISLLETARSFAELKKQGWSPRRTVMFALWDAEEFGLIGSTEWVEKHQPELEKKLVAYLNSDMNTAGKLGTGGVPALQQFFREVLRDNVDPKSGKDLLSLAEINDDGKPQQFRLSPLGSGSDYVAFIHHSGIPSLNIGFSKAGANGTYHSIYDSYAWYSKFMDPDFEYARALARVMGTALLRLADSPLLPFEYTAVEQNVREWAKQAETAHKVNISALSHALDRLKEAATQYEDAYRAAQPKFAAASKGAITNTNRTIIHAERALTDPVGLPGRDWYKHTLYAPGLYTGYSAKTLPGIEEAAARADAQKQVAPLAAAIERLLQQVQKATKSLAQAD